MDYSRHNLMSALMIDEHNNPEPEITLTAAEKERLLKSTPEDARALARRIVREELQRP